MLDIKNDFPIFKKNPDLVYLDSAATSQKPQVVIDAVADFYTNKNANIHRGIYKLAEDATHAYEHAREVVAQFIHADSAKEIIFTANTNQAINAVSYGCARKFLKKGDIIILTEMEHHANIVPWIRLKEEIGVELVYLPITVDYRLDYKSILDVENGFKPFLKDPSKIKLLTLTHASNVLGTINPIKDIVSFFKQINRDLKILVDAAQSVPHFPINVQQLDIDFLTFSSHKIMGPSGVGVLWGKEALLEEIEPLFVGSNMIHFVRKDKATWAEIPDKFEVGTGNLEGVVGLSAAIGYIQKIEYENIIQHETELTKYVLERLQTFAWIKLYGSQTPENRLGIFSFGIEGVHPHDIAQIVDRLHIGIRSGHHCAQPLMSVLKVPATARVSLHIYNTKEDIDKLFEGIELVKKTLRI